MAKYVKTEQGYQEIETTVAPVVNQEIETTVVPMVGEKMDKNNPVGTGSFSMGRKAGTVIGSDSHTEGAITTASGNCSHAEGGYTKAIGGYSHAEGRNTKASGVSSHAEGGSTVASGESSHAEGWSTTAGSQYQHVQGRYNVVDSQHKYAHIVGNGTTETARSNAHTLDWNGVGWFKNSVKVGGSSQDDSAAKTLATTDYVDTTVSTKISGKQDTLIQSGAAVGQIAKITAVDSNGKPTAWEAVDMPSGGGSVPTGGVTTLHISVTAVNLETMEATFTADKTPAEMKQASVNGPIWCVVTFAAGIMSEESMSIGVPPALGPNNTVAFGSRTLTVHDQVGENDVVLAVSVAPMDRWYMELEAFGGD